MLLSAVAYSSPSLSIQAIDLAAQYNVPCVDLCTLSSLKQKDIDNYLSEQLEMAHPVVLFLEETGLSLRIIQLVKGAIFADFYGPSVSYRRTKGGGRRQMLAKAVGLKKGACPTVIDCTAGLGRDAFVLASLGCRVVMLERVTVIHALLNDGLLQARIQSCSELNEILDRMELISSDAHNYLKLPELTTDVVYLDPMFPERNKGALVKKEMQIFHNFIGMDDDSDALLNLALSIAGQRVVVKRPRIAPYLSNSKPSYTLEGKSNRFDIYLV
tara:strand:- start:2204 stop:3016 length:813 start_codon:yes stop_codon:yes gene_type:complete